MLNWLSGFWVYVGILVGLLVLVLIFYASRYEKVGPNEVLIVSGRRGVYHSAGTLERVEKNFRIYHGGGTFVWPIRERVDRMSVELMTLEIRTPEFFTKYGAPIVVDGIAQIKVRSDDPIATATAAEMFLSKGRAEMNEIAHQMMQGHLRAVISTLTFEEIHANPEAFAQNVQKLTAEDLANMGIQVVSFTIRDIQDPAGFLTALVRPKLAEVQKDATLGEASAQRDSRKGKAIAEREATIVATQAEREACTAEIQTELAIAEAQRDRDIKQHEFSAQVAEAKAASDLAYDLQHAKTEQLVMTEKIGVTKVEREKQIEVEELEIARREKELVHSVQKPAEAERFRIETLAEAERRRVLRMAEAEAQAFKLKGEAQAAVIRAQGEAEAEVIRKKALAEAEGLRAKLLAEAEGMQQKAAAWEKYTPPAISQILIEQLPQIASAVARPLERIDKIVMVNTGDGDSTGVERVTRGVANVMAQIPGFAELLGSLNVGDVVQRLRATGKGKHSGSSEKPGTPESWGNSEDNEAL